MYVVYIIECWDGSLYTGITTDMARRFLEHQQKIGSRYTRAKGVRKIAYVESHPDRSSASKREWEIKSWSRGKKLDLIKSRSIMKNMKKDFSTLKRARQKMPLFVSRALSETKLTAAYRERPPYQQNDYLTWISRAVQEETKHKRLTQMLAELRKGRAYMGMKWRGRQ